jgi:hypothetical protein
MALQLKVNGVDKSSFVDWTSIEKSEVLTKEPDLLKFRIRTYDSKTYAPVLNDEVVLLEGTTKLFGGIVIEVIKETTALLGSTTINCKDYTQTLDRKLVSKTYEGMTANAIIADIISTFTTGFTGTHVSAPTIVQKIVFNYVPVSQALQKIAETLGDYDWYVDYDKDIHFFAEGAINAPFNLSDTSGNFLWDSLRYTVNIHQLRNHIIIRGGDVVGDIFENIQKADAVQRAFFVGYKLTDFTAYKALAGTPTTFVTLAVGDDGTDDEASFDALYNPNKGLLRFRDSNKPALDDRVKVTGKPIFPLLAEKTDLASVSLYGEYQYLITDASIKSKASASQRCEAELKKWGAKINDAVFSTYVDGLRTGQTISINSVKRNINQTFRITRINSKLRNATNKWQHDVQILASEKVGMVDVLNKLLMKDPTDQLSISDNEVVDRLYSANENLTLTESVVTSLSHNAQTDTLTLTENMIVQPFNYALEFVLAPYVPTVTYNGSDHKRVFLLGGSPLG